ncbi:pyrophosphate--fructose 6-phosphate 1-phosphotransferase subunit beta [Tanacetum coccineum]
MFDFQKSKSTKQIKLGMCGIASMDWSFKKLIGSIKWDEIAKLFPSLFGQHSAVLQPSESNDPASALKIGVVLSGGKPPGGHNVISEMFGKDPNV